MEVNEIVVFLVSFAGVPALNWIKAQLGLSGAYALAASLVLSLLIAGGALLYTGAFAGQDFFAIVAQVWAVSQVAYNLLHNS